jgi:uroporphyrinogen decarboxylase
MTPRQVIRTVFEGRRPPCVPWHFTFTREARQKLLEHFGPDDLDSRLGNHMLMLRRSAGSYDDIGGNRVRDLFGVEWDRSIDKDIGMVCNCLLPEPTMRHFTMPDALLPRWFQDFEGQIARGPDRFRVFSASYSLFERAWTLRGMENLLIDFHENPRFVHELLDALADFNIAHVRRVAKLGIDCVYFGDDWGQQHGLILGRKLWDEFIRPRVRRMYQAVHDEGLFVMIHCCGDVDELFDDLVEMGVNAFNPFQPEAMDVWTLLPQYRGRLAFFGGLSTQRTLPYGTPAQVRDESRRLLALGRDGGYVFAPAHAVEGDVPLENMLAFIEEAKAQAAE